MPARPDSWVIRGKTLEQALLHQLALSGGRIDENILLLESQMRDCSDRLEALGWQPISAEQQERFDAAARQGQQIQEEPLNHNTNP